MSGDGSSRRKDRQGRILAVSMISALAVAACSAGAGGQSPTGAGASPIGAASTAGQASSGAGTVGGTPVDTCSLLTQAEVSAALGMTVGAGTSTGTHGCQWTYSDPSSPLTLAQVEVDSNIDPKTFAQLCGAPSSSALGIKIVPVSGVGDTACYTESTLDDVLNFQKGNAGFSASLVAMGTLTARFQTAQVEAVEKALALKALARI